MLTFYVKPTLLFPLLPSFLSVWLFHFVPAAIDAKAAVAVLWQYSQ